MRFTHVSDHSRSTGSAPHAAVMNTVAIISLFMVVRISRDQEAPAGGDALNEPSGPRDGHRTPSRKGGANTPRWVYRTAHYRTRALSTGRFSEQIYTFR